MKIEDLNQFRRLLAQNNKSVSKLEYTRNNYDDEGNLIKEDLPTITTDFCEIGLYNGEFYFVFIINSITFNLKLFDKIKHIPSIKVYGLVDFNKNLYPKPNFKIDRFIKQIQKEKYLQFQFNYKNVGTLGLLKEYFILVSIFEKSKVTIVNQLKVDLTKGGLDILS